jgi:hypothetical protein
MNDITTPEVVEIKARDHREMNMALARMAGATYRQIGEEFGLSRQRVYQILTRMNVDVVGPTFGKAKYGHTPGENRFGWGTKAPDGRSYLAALAQQTKEQAKWLTA